MAGFLHFLKTIFIPLFVSLLIYISLTYALIPAFRRYRNRYSQYVPMPSSLDTISSRTSTLRSRVTDALFNLFLLPSNWSLRRRRVVDGSGGENPEDELFDDEEGEGMVGFDIDDRRREALEQRRSMMMGEDDRRLSRDLEEGFKDDSDDESEDERRRSLSRSRGSATFYSA